MNKPKNMPEKLQIGGEKNISIFSPWSKLPIFTTTRKKSKELAESVEQGEVPVLEHETQYATVKIFPAIISTTNGKGLPIFPSSMEETVFDGIIQLVVEKKQLKQVDENLLVWFSASELQKKLKGFGVSINYDQIIESISVLSGCNIEIIKSPQKNGEEACSVAGCSKKVMTMFLIQKSVSGCFIDPSPMLFPITD